MITRPPSFAISCSLAAAFAGACTEEQPAFERPTELVYLDQGQHWTARERALFYYTPQGTRLHGMRYSWFQHLEGPNGRIAAPENLAKFGFLYSPEQFDPNFEGGKLNPGNFPVGFAKNTHEDTGEAMLDISCSACHTGELRYKGVSMRVDGGQPMHAFAWLAPGQLVVDLLAALDSTYIDPLKFDRFARDVLGTRYPDAKPELREQLREAIAGFTTEGLAGASLYEDPGYGRLDALGRIADTVFGEDIDRRNERAADAPVSYPHLWDIWKFDWVQWNGSVAQPMGRNVGEALGVKARFDLVDRHGDRLPEDQLFESSVLIREQHCIESAMWQLGPPIWPEQIFPPIDRERVERGHELFEDNCRRCHGPHVYPPGSELIDEDFAVEPVRYDCLIREGERQPSPGKPVEWKMCVVPSWEIGTDPRVVDNVMDSRYDASVLDPGKPELRSLAAAQGLKLVMGIVSEKKIEELGLSEDEVFAMKGWGRENEWRDMRGYKSRPLHGIWATPPFLHNGSVRTIYQLLSPAPARESKVWVGSREYDPVHLGYENEKLEWAYELDTTELGNTNTGHQFTDGGGPGVIGPELTHEERLDLIEYLKALGNPTYDPDYEEYAAANAGPVDCSTDLQGPAQYPELKWPNTN